jgi:hypothetical protein
MEEVGGRVTKCMTAEVLAPEGLLLRDQYVTATVVVGNVDVESAEVEAIGLTVVVKIDPYMISFYV